MRRRHQIQMEETAERNIDPFNNIGRCILLLEGRKPLKPLRNKFKIQRAGSGRVQRNRTEGCNQPKTVVKLAKKEPTDSK